MDKRTVFADGLILPRAIKVLDHGVLVAEPPNLWLMHDTNGDLKMDTKELVTDHVRPPRGARRAERQRSALGSRQLDAHGRQRHLPALQERQVRGRRRPWSRGEWGVTHDDAGRIYRNTNESSVHVDFVPTPYYAPQSQSGDARAAATRRSETTRTRSTPCGRSGRTRHEPRVPDRDRSAGRQPGQVHLRLRAADLPGRSTSRRHLRQRVRRGAGRQPREPDHPQRRRDDAESEEGVRRGGVPRLHRRALPPGVPLERPGRHALHRRHVSRRHPAARRHHAVPARLHHQERARTAGSARPHLPRRARLDEARTPTAVWRSATPAQLVAALSHPNGWWRDTAQQLLVERGDRAVVPALDEAGARRAGLADADCSTLDARRPGRHRHGARRSRRSRISQRQSAAPAIRISERWLGRREPVRCRPRCSNASTTPTGGCGSSWRRRSASLPAGARERAIVTLLERRGDDPIAVDAALSGVRGTEGAVLEELLAGRRGADAAARRGADDGRVDDRARRRRTPRSRACSGRSPTEARPAWMRAAVLRGAEVALLGAPAPGCASPAVAARRRRTCRVRPARADAPARAVRMPSRRRRRWTSAPAPPDVAVRGSCGSIASRRR